MTPDDTLVGLVLLWIGTIRVPDLVASAAGTLAGASLDIYVTHWVVYPHLEAWSPLAATVASVAVGLAYLRLDTAVQHRVSGPRRSSRDPARTHRRADTPRRCAPLRGE